ncbi:unnamed protein product [Urochloa humidicola]
MALVGSPLVWPRRQIYPCCCYGMEKHSMPIGMEKLPPRHHSPLALDARPESKVQVYIVEDLAGPPHGKFG